MIFQKRKDALEEFDFISAVEKQGMSRRWRPTLYVHSF